jgi:hypothetical protein
MFSLPLNFLGVLDFIGLVALAWLVCRGLSRLIG